MHEVGQFVLNKESAKKIAGGRGAKVDEPVAAIDLLALIDPAKDAVHGNWNFNETGELVSDAGQNARIRIP